MTLETDASGRVISFCRYDNAPAIDLPSGFDESNFADWAMVDGELVYAPVQKEEPVNDEDRIKALEETNQMLLECIMEMSEIVYG